jgi:transcriptional regulator with XRE-family HTH domain
VTEAVRLHLMGRNDATLLSKKLTEFLLRSRKQLGLSREQLARRAQVSTRLVAELERGERPNVSLESTLRLLNLVGVSIVARAPDGAVALIRNDKSVFAQREARAALRRRTWAGGHVRLRNGGEPPAGGRSRVARLSAVSQLSRHAFALSAARQSPARRSSAGDRRKPR